MQDNKQALACGFVSIGAEDGDGVYLTDLIPACDSSSGDIIIEMLNDAGVAKEGEIYSYYKGSFDYADGWWNDYGEQVGEDVDDVFFPAGQGLWITGMSGFTWVNAGQVYDADKSIPLADNKQMLANPYPTSIYLDRDVSVGCDGCSGDVIIETLNDAGVAVEGQIYSFYKGSWDYADGWWTDWGEQVGVDINDVELKAGQGLWITGMADLTLDFTSPLK